MKGIMAAGHASRPNRYRYFASQITKSAWSETYPLTTLPLAFTFLLVFAILRSLK